MIGRPSSYTEEKGDEICLRLADGESLKKICDEKGQPSRPTVYKWLKDYPAFFDKYTRARTEQADTLADEIISIADKAEDAQIARLQMDARKWAASKLAPKKYGDKLGVDHSGSLTINVDYGADD